MQTLRRFCLLVLSYSVLQFYHRFFRIFLRSFFHMDYFSSTFKFFTHACEIGCGFLLLGSFYRVFNVFGMILIFGFCMKILNLRWHSDGLIRYLYEFGGKPRNRLYLKLKSCQNPNSPNKTSFVDKDNLIGHVSHKEGEDHHDEDDVFDVIALRKLVKNERQRASTAYEELEKERTASSSAADEALAMILRLQSEKSSVEIQSNQYRRVVEQKEEYDQNVIDSLRSIIKEQESERDLLLDRLKLYREKLSELVSEDEIEQLDRIHESRDILDLSAEEEQEQQEDDDDPKGSDLLISYLEMDSQPKELVISERC